MAITFQAFEPPLDMSHDVDDCGCSHFEQPPNDMNVCSHESAAASGSCCSKPDEACCGEPSNMMSKPADSLAPNEVSARWPCDVLHNDCLNCKFWFQFYVFSFRSLTSVDNNRRWTLKVVLGLILGAVWQAGKITK